MADTSFIQNVNTDKVTQLLSDTQTNVSYFEKITNDVVAAYTSHLDNTMKAIYEDIISVNNPSLDILEKRFLELSNCMYFMAEKAEGLGIYAAVSESAYKEVYNNSYLANQIPASDKEKKKTVAELTALAENSAVYESTVNDIYERAYKIVKQKLEAANTMISTLSKIISKRLSEMQLTSMQPTSPRILNEG